MTYSGARGPTAYEMCLVLGFCRLTFNVHAMFRVTLESLNSPDSQYALLLANGLFVNDRFNILPSFTNLLATYYSAGFETLDFNNDAAGSADYINQWVEERTNDKIQNLLKPGQVQDSPQVLVNTIYFKGDWKCQFSRTTQAHFHTSNSKQSMVKMMLQTAKFGYSENDFLQCQILELPYCGDRLAMYILLPRETEGLASLESKLTFKTVTSALAKVRKQKLKVGIPKFDITKDLGLVPILNSMGIKRAFTPSADFTGISTTSLLFVKDVIHKAFVKVDEKGTEAAAATAVVWWLSLPSVNAQFLADHPFVFLIRDQTTGSILFLGRLVQP